MATGEQPNPLESKNSTRSTRRNESENQWLLPNNLELGTKEKPKKQRNKETHKQKVNSSRVVGSLPIKTGSSLYGPSRIDDRARRRSYDSEEELLPKEKPKKQRNREKHNQKENLSSSAVVGSLSIKPGSFLQTTSPDEGIPITSLYGPSRIDKARRRSYDSEEIFSDSSDLIQTSNQLFRQPHQHNVNFPPNQAFSDLDHREHQLRVKRLDNARSEKDELKQKESATICEILTYLQEFISEAESSTQKLDLSDEPVIKDAVVKLKNAVKDVEGDRENKLLHVAKKHGFTDGVSRSSSASRISNSKENVVNRDSSLNAMHCNEKEQAKCNYLHEKKAPVLEKKALVLKKKMSVPEKKLPEAESASSDDFTDYSERKKQNKLIEIEEGKKLKDELKEELRYLKAANAASCTAEFQKTKEKKKKLCKYQTPSQHRKMSKEASSEDNQNIILESSDIPSEMISRQNSSFIKRDNVRKEQNSAFPARRHYEAEGRANEDPDIPVASVPGPSSIPDKPEIHDKMTKLKIAQHHVKVIKDIVVSISESRRTGIPLEQLLHSDNFFSDEESSEDSERDKEFRQAAQSSSYETATNVKEVCSEGLKTPILDLDRQKLEDHEQAIEHFVKLQSQFQYLMQTSPSSDRRNDDPVRSSGEGAYTQRKNPNNIVTENVQNPPPPPIRSVPLQDNLQLTRQNILISESQNSHSNSNLHIRDCNSVKKDNINNLSGKMEKLSIQNSMNSSYPDMLTGSNNNMDTMSISSYELNQNHSVPNDIERKKLIHEILKRNYKKHKQNARNQDKTYCNSSVDSEPLEGSNSALAVDSTAVAAWGGSSAQESFEDENEVRVSRFEEMMMNCVDEEKNDEHALRFEEMMMMKRLDEEKENEDKRVSRRIEEMMKKHVDEEKNKAERVARFEEMMMKRIDEENTSVLDKASLRGRGSASQYCNPFSNRPHYMESVANIPVNTQRRNCDHPFFNRNQNQSVLQTEYPQHSAQPLKPSRRPIQSPNSNAGLSRDFRDASCPADTAEHCSQHHQSPKFFQQLKNHIDQLNALCQTQIYCDRSQTSTNCQTPGYQFPNICGPFQPEPELAHPYNQQLLLRLSQCYHALYMQQLEIQQLQRCIWHNMDPENVQQPNNQSSRSHHEDLSFRPYSAPAWLNPFAPSSNFPPDISPIPSAATVCPPYPSHNGSYGSVSGTQPARAVIHPTSQNNIASQETLNNQVPPRTRANNFWDNFRSYSRQNLLSTSNTNKRNENISSLSTPQVRQVHPLITNESQHNVADTSSANCNVAFAECNRRVQNQGMQDAVNISKKIKSNAPPSATISNSFQKKSVSSARVAQSGFKKDIRTNKSDSPVREVIILNDVSKVKKAEANTRVRTKYLGPGEGSSDKTIRYYGICERMYSEDESETDLQNDQTVPSTSTESATTSITNQQSSIKQPVEAAVSSSEINEIERTPVVSDNASANIHNLPTAAIPPLNKQDTPRSTSTGAVRKKTKLLSACLQDSITNGSPSQDSGGSTADSSDPPAVLNLNKTIEDVPTFITEKVLSDLVSMLPFIKRRSLRDGCYRMFWTFISDCLIESFRTHMFYCNINLSRKSLLHLRQTVCHFISVFSGITLSDFDSVFLKYIQEFIFENISCFIASGHFPPLPTTVNEENCSFGVEDMDESYLKLPDNIKSNQMRELSIKMPLDETDNVSSQIRTTSQQNLFQSLCSYENLVPGLPLLSDSDGATVEDFECGCNPEAEIEPEVEIGTEADLAEADQSPGQQGSISDSLPPTEIWSADQEAVLIRNVPSTGAVTLNEDDVQEMENSSEGAVGGSQISPDACINQETILDDIPIKLCPSEEELPEQLKDELQLPSEF